MTCRHQHGDTILGMWVCGQCFKKLPERPVQHVMERSSDPGGRPPRQIAIKCPISTAADGITLCQFVTWMASRLVARTAGQMPHAEAIDYGIGLLETLGDGFGSEAQVWDRGGAYEIVDEELQYWDADERQSN